MNPTFNGQVAFSADSLANHDFRERSASSATHQEDLSREELERRAEAQQKK